MAAESESKLNNRTSAQNVKILVVLILAILSLVILSNSMTKPVGRDEHMYCTGAVLLAQGKIIYRDFSYVAQLPYHPLLYATLLQHFQLLGCASIIFVWIGK